MKKNKIKTNKKIDLHGMTQDEAFNILASQIETCYEQEKRKLLIITGKSGILKVNVPRWLGSNPIFTKYILSKETAPIEMGGEGALIITLKKL